MQMNQIGDVVRAALEGRRLLQHPFYRRWEAGDLEFAELGPYASQYSHFERMLPDVLQTVATRLPDGAPRHMVLANLADEMENPLPHVELFAEFEEAVGAQESPPTPATSKLLSLYRTSAMGEPMNALAVLAAYEVQSSEIARSKAEGLRSHYGLDDSETSFWDVHATLEEDHASWTLKAMCGAPEADSIFQSSRASADAWWEFLDEREAAKSMLG